jgi:hypothetical protein
VWDTEIAQKNAKPTEMTIGKLLMNTFCMISLVFRLSGGKHFQNISRKIAVKVKIAMVKIYANKLSTVPKLLTCQ